MAGRRSFVLLMLVFGPSCSGRVLRSDDNDPDAASGTGGKAGTAASAGRGGAGGAAGTNGASASTGRGGTGASTGGGGTAGASTHDAGAGSGGLGGAACREATAIAECKARLRTEGTCSARADCSCDQCSCEHADCEQVTSCVAIRMCIARTRCCAPDDTACVGRACTDACVNEIAKGAEDQGLTLILATRSCVSAARCVHCPTADSGS
jgi:hypothetical protein